MKHPLFAARSLFVTIFLWFFAAQLLIGAALYALAAATERRYDRGTFEMAGGYIEARARASAVAFEVGGPEALQRAWRVAQNSRDRPPGRPGRGSEDRDSAALYVLRSGKPQLLAGAPLPAEATKLIAGNETFEGTRGGLWLARHVRTERGEYVGVIRLRTRGGPGHDGPGREGPRGFWEEIFSIGHPNPDGPPWSSALRWGVIALVMGALCYGLARYLTAPALQISHAARAFAAGDYAVRVGPQLGARRDELAELGHDFDFMAARIETQRAAERRLLGDISHELRSPLARLQVALDLAESDANASTRAYLHRIEEEVEELGTLIGQLLTLTRLENAEPLQNAQIIDLSELVAHVCADADFEASASGRTVELRENQSAKVSGDEALLRSAIENVVRNALVHAPDSRVEVSLQTTEAEAIIRVRDWGPGAPEATLGTLFDPFFRVNHARDRQSGGTGLGLSITQRALVSHGGSARAFNAADGGLEIELRLPLARSDKKT